MDKSHKKILEYAVYRSKRRSRAYPCSFKNGEPYVLNTACHAGVNRDTVRRESYLINIISAGEDEIETPRVQTQAEFLTSRDGPFKKVIEYLGDDFVILEDKKGIIRGWYIKRGAKRDNLNSKLLMSFMKCLRGCTEHQHTLPFWEKFVLKHKVPRSQWGLVWLMSFYFDEHGGKKVPSHSCFDSVGDNICLSRFINPDHNDWGLTDDEYIKADSYMGETKYTYGSTPGQPRFRIHKDIRVREKNVHKETINTRFYKNFYGVQPKKLSDKAILEFLEDAEKGAYV